jgi:hypothetical protein
VRDRRERVTTPGPSQSPHRVHGRVPTATHCAVRGPAHHGALTTARAGGLPAERLAVAVVAAGDLVGKRLHPTENGTL